MTQTDPAIANAPTAPVFDPDRIEAINTRFGELSIDKNKIITFAEGLYGLENHHLYMLTRVSDWPDSFKLLQSLEDPELSFIVLPIDRLDGPIDREDVVEACRTLGFDEEATVVLGIVTVRADSEIEKFTVNLKAPVLIDTACRTGRQHVFASEKYRLRHVMPADGHQEGRAHGT